MQTSLFPFCQHARWHGGDFQSVYQTRPDHVVLASVSKFGGLSTNNSITIAGSAYWLTILLVSSGLDCGCSWHQPLLQSAVVTAKFWHQEVMSYGMIMCRSCSNKLNEKCSYWVNLLVDFSLEKLSETGIFQFLFYNEGVICDSGC